MKKIFLLALATAFVANASAEGYQVNTLSTKQLGMAHTGVAQKLDSESVWFNPAAAAHQEQKFTISGGMTGIAAVATWTSYDGTDSQKSDNKLSTPIFLNANLKLTKKLAVGLSLNTPYGSSMDWGNDSWAGAHLIQDISLQSYCVQPTVSYKITEKLSVGAGLMVSWGNVELSKSLFPVGDQSNATLSALTGSDFSDVENRPLGSITMSGETAIATGFNVGIMYDVCKKLSIGASYRSKMMMKIDAGDTDVSFYDDATAATLTALSSDIATMQNGTFSSELPMPSTFSVGVTLTPISMLKISAEMQMVGWSSYESLDFLFTSGDATYENNSPKNYNNTFIYRLGAELSITKGLKARAGIYYDESPVSDDFFAPETPSMNKIGYTCGISIKPLPIPNLSLDLAYGYISPASHDRTASYTSVDGLQGAAYLGYTAAAAQYAAAGDATTSTYLTSLATDAASKANNTFGGKYRAVANTFSVGLSWGF